MIPGKNYKPESLSKWLEIATNGIAPAGKERITKEIEVHYAEAVESHILRGEPEPVAQAMAIAALGEATEAAKRFRKNHFTEDDIKCLSKMRKDAAKLRYLFLNLLIPLAFYIFCRLFLGDPKNHPYFIAIMFPMVVLPILSFVIASRPATSAKVSWLILVELATGIACGLAAFSWIVGRSEDASGAYWGIAGALLPVAIRQLRLWNKARKLLFGTHDECVLTEPLPE